MTEPNPYEGLAGLTSAQIIQRAQKVRAARIGLARKDFTTFVRMVLKDEETGDSVDLAPVHSKWAKLIEENKRLIIWAHVESGKTNGLTIARSLYEIGKNPNLRIAIVSNTQDQASKIVQAIARYIIDSEEYSAIFPGVQRSEPWTSTKLHVVREAMSKDPTVQAFGVHGAITGARVDLLILDDVLDYENCRTFGGRQDLWDWYHATLAGRLTRQARVIIVGTAFHPDDLLHRFSENTQVWASQRFPVVSKEGELTWPERWPLARIEAKKLELGPLEFARQMLCMARDDSDARVKREWIEQCLSRGAGWQLLPALPQPDFGDEDVVYVKVPQ